MGSAVDQFWVVRTETRFPGGEFSYHTHILSPCLDHDQAERMALEMTLKRVGKSSVEISIDECLFILTYRKSYAKRNQTDSRIPIVPN